MSKQYVKRPVIIEAVQWNGSNKAEIQEFCGDKATFENLSAIQMDALSIKTLEGVLDAKIGDFIIKGIKGEFYPCKEDIFHSTYDPVELPKKNDNVTFDVIDNEQPIPKSLHNTTSNGARKNVKDIQFWGDGDMFKLLSKASSENEGWFKSTKAMQITGVGCVVQCTTQQRNPDGSYAIGEATAFVPNAKIKTNLDEQKNVVSRELVSINTPL